MNEVTLKELLDERKAMHDEVHERERELHKAESALATVLLGRVETIEKKQDSLMSKLVGAGIAITLINLAIAVWSKITP